MPTKEDYRVLQGNFYFEVLDLEEAKTEEDLRKAVKRLRAKLASTMAKEDIAWIEGQRRGL